MRIGWIRGCEIRVHWLTLAMAVLAGAADRLGPFMTGFAAILCHELTHMLAAALTGCRVVGLQLLPFGSVARIEGLYEEEPRREILIALAGPAANVLLVMAFTTLNSALGVDFPQREFFVEANMHLALFNLLPFLPMDGGRVLRGALAQGMGLGRATRLAALLGAAGGLTMAVLALARRAGENRVTVLLIAACVVLCALGQARGAAWLWLGELTGRKRQLMQDKALPIRQIAARRDMTLGELARCFVPHRYHLVTVVDGDLCPIATVSEQQIVDAMIKRGSHVRIFMIISGKG